MSARHKPPADRPAPAWPAPTIRGDVRDIPLAQIEPDPQQPRKEFDPDSLASLAGSLRSLGQLQPIRVRRLGDDHRYAIVAGERRWRAAHDAGLRTLACVIVDGHDDAGERLVEQLAENAAREGLSALEEAEAFRAALERPGATQKALAYSLGISQGCVSKRIGLLKLAEEVRDLIASGDLDPSTAYELGRLPEWDQIDVAAQACAGGWTRARVTEEVERILAPPPPKPDPEVHVKPLESPGKPGATITDDGRGEDAAGAATGPPPASPVPGPAGGVPGPSESEMPAVYRATADEWLEQQRERVARHTAESHRWACLCGPVGGQARVSVDTLDVPGAVGRLEALRHALARALWEEDGGAVRPIDQVPGADYDPIRDPVPDGVAQCSRCHRRRPLEPPVDGCPECGCPEFGVSSEGERK